MRISDALTLSILICLIANALPPVSSHDMRCKVFLAASLVQPLGSGTSGITTSNTHAVGGSHEILYANSVNLAQIPIIVLEGPAHKFRVHALSCAQDVCKAESEAVPESWPRAGRGQILQLDQIYMPPGIQVQVSHYM